MYCLQILVCKIVMKESSPELPQNAEEAELRESSGSQDVQDTEGASVITINVGGVLFSTHGVTLQKVPEAPCALWKAHGICSMLMCILSISHTSPTLALSPIERV